MQDRPDNRELLECVEDFLRDDLLPELEGGRSYQLRVALNLLGILKRQLLHADEQHLTESNRLGKLVAHGEGDTLESLNKRLCDAIGSGEMDESFETVLAALKAITADKLAVVRPGYQVAE